jgi:hypothetical protein
MQEASLDTLRRCAAACDLRDECFAFSFALTSDSTGGLCTLRGALHEGLIPHFLDIGEFALDSRHDGPLQVKARPP